MDWQSLFAVFRPVAVVRPQRGIGRSLDARAGLAQGLAGLTQGPPQVQSGRDPGIEDRIVAAMRLLLAFSALITVLLDPSEPDRFVAATYTCLALYVGYSIAAYLVALAYSDTAVSNNTTYYYVVRAYNASGESVNSPEASATPRVVCGTVTVSSQPDPLPGGTAGATYAGATCTAAGTAGPFSFSLAGGSLPHGITLSPTGVLSGTPTNRAAGKTYAFVVMAADINGCSGSGNYTVPIAK